MKPEAKKRMNETFNERYTYMVIYGYWTRPGVLDGLREINKD